MKARVAALVSAGMLTVGTAAWGQTADGAPGSSMAFSALSVNANPDPGPPRFGRRVEHSLGMRTWLWTTPVWMVCLFATVANNWSGPLSASPAIEYTYRSGSLDLVIGLQYTNLSTSDPNTGLIRGRNETDFALERIESQLWLVSVNALFLWSSRINDWFEIQYGTGIGVSYVGGDLYRTQVTDNGSGGYRECSWAQRGTSRYCDASNVHYVGPDGTTRYSEARTTSGGSVPPAIPFVALPHLALHFRPHRHFDIRVDGGFGLIGFYGGLAAHYVF